MGRSSTCLTVAVALLLVGCGAGEQLPQAESTPSNGESSPPDATPGAAPSSTASALAPLPAGWRWESYRDVVIGVPGSWGYENGSQRTSQWCIGENPKPPAIGRPGASTAAGCPLAPPAGPPQGTLIAEVGEFVAFDPARGADPAPPAGADPNVTTEGDRVTIRVGSVAIAVQTEPRLREQIIATARQVDADHNGCPSTDPISADPSRRPDHPAAADSLRGVQRIAACRYALDTGFTTLPPGPTLLSSLQLTGDQATAVIAGIAAAPNGGGPNSPESCSVEIRYGDEVIVLRVAAESGESQIYVRFSGCDHHGYDDGAAVRALTRPVVTQLIKDSNTPLAWSMSVSEVLGHDMPEPTAKP